MLKNFFVWKEGRQGSGYYKMLLAQSSILFCWDLYLIKFPEKSFITDHKDPVKNKRHFRLNFVLSKAKSGGIFVCEDRGLLFDKNRITLFGPDIALHSVTKIDKGTRYVLSFGFII